MLEAHQYHEQWLCHDINLVRRAEKKHNNAAEILKVTTRKCVLKVTYDHFFCFIVIILTACRILACSRLRDSDGGWYILMSRHEAQEWEPPGWIVESHVFRMRQHTKTKQYRYSKEVYVFLSLHFLFHRLSISRIVLTWAVNLISCAWTYACANNNTYKAENYW